LVLAKVGAYECATPVALMGCVINEKSATERRTPAMSIFHVAPTMDRDRREAMRANDRQSAWNFGLRHDAHI